MSVTETFHRLFHMKQIAWVPLKRLGDLIVCDMPRRPNGAPWFFIGFTWCPCGCKAEMAVYETGNGKQDTRLADIPASIHRVDGGDVDIQNVHPDRPVDKKRPVRSDA